MYIYIHIFIRIICILPGARHGNDLTCNLYQCTYTYVYIQMYTCTNIYIHVSMYLYLKIFVYVCISMFSSTYIYTYIYK